MQPTSFIRKQFSIPIFLYIDDRLVEEVRKKEVKPGVSSAYLANYIVCEVLTRYCLNLGKSVFIPSQSPVFLGFISDSVESCFRLTENKKTEIH